MSPAGAPPQLRIAFVGAFAIRLVERVRAHLDIPCDIIQADEVEVVSQLPEVDVLVTMAFTAEMGAASRQLKLVQVPGAGLDRIDQSALPTGTWLANAYGHETGIAEYVIGAMLALTRSFNRLDASLRQGLWESQWTVSTPPPAPWPELAGKTLGILGYGHIGHGCGPWGVWALCSVTWLCLACVTCRRQRCSILWSSAKVCWVMGSPRSLALSQPRSFRAGTTALSSAR